jgi:hypothetical protein
MIGQTFAPLGDPTQQQGPGGPGGPGGNVGQAIQTLSLRYPRVVGAGSPIPQALLEGQGSAGLPQGGNPIIDAILRGILGNFRPSMQTAPSAQGGMTPQVKVPTPVFTPINPSEGLSERPPYTPPAPTRPGPEGPRDFPEHTRESAIIGGGFQEGRGIRY